jgi:hypothetical protein
VDDAAAAPLDAAPLPDEADPFVPDEAFSEGEADAGVEVDSEPAEEPFDSFFPPDAADAFESLR